VADHRDRGSQGQDARRQDIPPEQSVDQRALTSLELTQHSQVEPRLGEPSPTRPQLVYDPRREEFAGAADQLVDRSQDAPPGSDGDFAVLSRHR
jgi:hypothetical protein